MFGKVAYRAGITVLLVIWAIGCADNRKVVSPPEPSTELTANLWDYYDPTMRIPWPPDQYGEGAFTLNPAGTHLSFDVSFSFFSNGNFGEAKFYLSPEWSPSGQPVRTIQPSEVSGNRIRGVWRNTDSEPLTPALVNSLLAGSIFIQVVAEDSTGLDIGQLLTAP
ncbi:MAG: hypothetical protein L0Z48_11895 [candidate division Zixibacteria bacterium]|nr:hypothetical protein [candidate division Zixibacteria bacterium]MCI0597226.1 hypothetical protein [candidate division Zixibacteria bacterium]